MSLPVTKIFKLLVPVYDWGTAALVMVLASGLGLIAIFGEPDLALYIGVGAYLGIVIRSFLMGVTPDEIEVYEQEVGPIETMLNSGRLIEVIGGRIWAPSRYKSWWWRSARISLTKDKSGRFCLKARRRDLKLVLANLKQQGLR